VKNKEEEETTTKKKENRINVTMQNSDNRTEANRPATRQTASHNAHAKKTTAGLNARPQIKGENLALIGIVNVWKVTVEHDIAKRSSLDI
jgi:hypothetical protein